jgi:4-amino-4-deoxy-L-arabinose transferase-like glycosyltransferase
MSPTVYGLDSAELTTGAYTLGIVHPPGSPLFLLLGHLFTYLPFGDIGYRVNLLSACAAALTVFFLYRLLWTLTGQRLIAITASWFFAFTYYFWTSALAAELYSLQACFIALLLLLLVKWIQQKQTKVLYTLAFLFGIGLGNHLSLILLAPGIIWIVLSHRSQIKSIWTVLASVGFVCLGSSIYLYLPIRYSMGAALDYAHSYWDIDLMTMNGIWWMISGQEFRSLFWAHGFNGLGAELIKYLKLFWSNFLGLGVIFGILGIIHDFKQRTSFHIGLGLMWIAYLIFYIPYGAVDKDVMFLPTYIIWCIWLGLGVGALQNIFKKWFSPPYEMLAYNTLFFLALGGLVFNLPYVDLSNDWSARQEGELIFQSLEPHSIYYGSWIDIPILEYLQIVEGKRSDVVTRNLVFMNRNSSQKLAKNHLLAGFPVYTSTSNWFDERTFIHYPIFPCSCYQLTLRNNEYQQPIGVHHHE